MAAENLWQLEHTSKWQLKNAAQWQLENAAKWQLEHRAKWQLENAAQWQLSGSSKTQLSGSSMAASSIQVYEAAGCRKVDGSSVAARSSKDDNELEQGGSCSLMAQQGGNGMKEAIDGSS